MSSGKRKNKTLTSEEKADLETDLGMLNTAVKELGESAISSSNVVSATRELSVKLRKCNKLGQLAFETTSRKGIELDAGFFVKSGHVSTKLAKAIESDSKTFDRNHFAANLANLLSSQPLRDLSQNQSRQSTNKRISNTDLVEFGANYAHLIRDVPVYQFMFGVVDGPDVAFEPKPKKARTARSRMSAAPLTRPASFSATQATETSDDRTAKSVQAIFSKLKKECRKGDDGCASYIEAINDRSSFSKTVENIFHSAFLIKEGVVALNKPDGSKCTVKVVGERGQQEAGTTMKTRQKIMSFSMEDWARWNERA